jgi:hypothetical protein
LPLTRTETAPEPAELSAPRHSLEARIDRVVVRLGSLMVVLTGLLFAALHYWPPAGHG